MNETDFTIIIPLYNQEKYIEQCLESALNQDFSGKYEVIVVNDGSTDKSEEIIKNFKDEKLKIFKNENKGPAYSRNFGNKKASGKYIVYLDSDDILDKNCLQVFYDKNLNQNADIILAPYWALREHKKDIKFYFPLKKFIQQEGFLNIKNTKGEILNANFEPWAKAYLRDFILDNKIEFIDAALAEDLPFFYKSVLNTKKILLAKKPVYFYRKGHKRLYKKGRIEWVKETIKAVLAADEVIKGYKDFPLIEKIYAKNCLRVLNYWTRQFRKLPERKIFLDFSKGFLEPYGLKNEFILRVYLNDLVDICQNKC